MRRALEHLKYHGYWSSNSDGNLEGVNGKNLFRTQIIAKGERLFDFSVIKKNVETQRETKPKKFIKKNVSKIQLGNISKEFMQQVVTDIM